MSSLQAVQIALERRSATTAVGSTADERQEEQTEAAGYVQRTGSRGGTSKY